MYSIYIYVCRILCTDLIIYLFIYTYITIVNLTDLDSLPRVKESAIEFAECVLDGLHVQSSFFTSRKGTPWLRETDARFRPCLVGIFPEIKA